MKSVLYKTNTLLSGLKKYIYISTHIYCKINITLYSDASIILNSVLLQHANKVAHNSPRASGFAFGIVNFVLHLSNRCVKFLGNIFEEILMEELL